MPCSAFEPQVLLLVAVERAACRLMYSWAASRKPPVPQAGSQISLAGLGPDAIDDRLDQRPRREVLAGAALGVLRVLLEQPLVGVALHVGVEAEPALAVDQVHDQAA